MDQRWLVAGTVLLAACNAEETPACNGEGDPSAAIGVEEVVGGFVPYEDGDTLPVVEDTIEVAYEITGIDTREPVTVVLRLGRPGAGTTDYVANADLRCAEPGPARYSAQGAWPGGWPDPATLDGTTITVDTVFTDVREVSAEVGVDLLVDANP